GQTHHFFAFFHALGVDLGILGFFGVGVDADPVAEPSAAEHGVDRDAVNFAGDVPQSHFDRADSPTLPGRTAELFDFAEELIELERVFAEEAALQEQRIGWAGAVTHFAKAIDALIGVDSDDRTGTRARFLDDGYAQVGDFQLGRTGVGIDAL